MGEGGGRAEGCFRILEGIRFGKGWAYRILARVVVGVGVRRPPGRSVRPTAPPPGRTAGHPDSRTPGHLDSRTPGLPPPRAPSTPSSRPREPPARSAARPPGCVAARPAARPPGRSAARPPGSIFALGDAIPMLFTESEKVRFGRYKVTWPTKQWAK